MKGKGLKGKGFTVNELKRSWFDLGSRHALANRISDIEPFLVAPQENLSALDLGCAEGQISKLLCESFNLVHSVERAPNLKIKTEENVKGLDNIHVFESDIFQWEPILPDYDFVFLLGVLHYFYNDADKAALIDKYAKLTNHYFIIRTSFRENKVLVSNDPDAIVRATPLDLIFQVLKENNFRYFFLDNSYRDEKINRLGDLIIAKRCSSPYHVSYFI
jgi:hypothetical protein